MSDLIERMRARAARTSDITTGARTTEGLLLEAGADQIESLQRENEALKAELAARTHNYEYWREYAESLKAAAITPEMRERMRKALQIIEEHNITTSIYAETDAGVIFRDLLGEQGGMGDE